MRNIVLSLLKKEVYRKYYSVALKSVRSDSAKEILLAVDVVHEKTDGDVSFDDLLLTVATCYTEKKSSSLVDVLESWRGSDYNEGLVTQYFDEELKKAFAYDVALAGLDFSEGRSTFEQFSEALSSAPDAVVEEEFPFVPDSLDFLKENAVTREGVSWRLNVLNKLIGRIPRGKFGFLFARPETGKSTFLCSEIPFMASQLKDEEPVLWIANEEETQDIMLRCFQSTFSITEAQLFSDTARYGAQFTKKLGGRLLINADIESNNRAVIEGLVEKYKPGILVIDQLDNVEGFKDSDKREVMLGQKYRWARVLAKDNNMVVIAVTQAAASAEGKKYLNMTDVEEAKTQKQKHADFILGIGRDPDNENMRYFHTCKDKLPLSNGKDPNMRHGFGEAVIKGDISRYYDVGYQEAKK